MQFLNNLLLAAIALASTAFANTVDFVNQDSTTRTIYFTGNSGMATISALTVPGLSTVTQSFDEGWVGNWYSVSEGADNVVGMLGEVSWNSYAGATYFDVSAIVNPDDDNGVKEIYPKTSLTPMSGCQTFPCSNAYNQADDIQTLSTSDDELVCLIGTLASTSVRRHARDFVTSASPSSA